MTVQPRLSVQPTLDEAVAIGAQQMAESFEAADARWCIAVEQWIRRLPVGFRFIAEDAVLAVAAKGYRTSNAKAGGAIVKAMSRKGWIEPTGDARRARTSHGALKPVWSRTGRRT